MSRQSVPESVRVAAIEGGLTRIDVSTRLATAQAFIYGAHLTQWTPSHATESVLWLSGRSRFAPGVAIRGGVPICLPWFGPHPTSTAAPAHGFARLVEWTFAGARESPDNLVTLAFVLEHEAGVRPDWPQPFRATYRVTIGSTLTMALAVENVGGAPLRFQEALHTYFTVGDVEQIAIAGLEGVEYLDKVEGFARKRQANAPLRFSGETDRVYVDTTSTCRITDPLLRRVITVEKTGSHATVVWNPGVERATALADLGDPGWREMVCVETVNARESAVELEPGATHTMSAAISVSPS